jgi:hypothetical protein
VVSAAVIYDSAGQLALPAKRRSHAWQSIVSWHLSAGAFLAYADHDDAYLSTNFYFVLVPLEAEDGNDEK